MPYFAVCFNGYVEEDGSIKEPSVCFVGRSKRACRGYAKTAGITGGFHSIYPAIPKFEADYYETNDFEVNITGNGIPI